MDLIEIKYLIAKAGLSFVAIDRQHGFREGTIRIAISKPHKKAEQVLAEVLNVTPKEIFPERYDANGKRHNPQPRLNYSYNYRGKVGNN